MPYPNQHRRMRQSCWMRDIQVEQEQDDVEPSNQGPTGQRGLEAQGEQVGIERARDAIEHKADPDHSWVIELAGGNGKYNCDDGRH